MHQAKLAVICNPGVTMSTLIEEDYTIADVRACITASSSPGTYV